LGSGEPSEFEAGEITRHAAFGAGEPDTEGDGAESLAPTRGVKKRDEIGLNERDPGAHLMHTQKQEILEFIEKRKRGERTIAEILANFSVSQSSFYRWRKAQGAGALQEQRVAVNPRTLSPFERERILAVKAANPELRHRRVQGELQKEGLFISATSVYQTLKNKGLVEPYARRESPWNEPRYEVWGRCRMWGADWTKMRVNHERWYLLTLIDFFSRKIVAWELASTVNAAHITRLYRDGLDNENIPLNWRPLPELRVDRGSPNTSDVTKKFFKDIEADLSWARVRRPTDNAITERFYGTIKQEELYVVGSYPDLASAKAEIAKYIEFYNERRPHQALWNFTPNAVHEENNKTETRKLLRKIKLNTLMNRRDYWLKECDSRKN